MISCILLSAGFNSRFGSPKALAKLKGLTVIERVQKQLLKAPLDEIVIVLGAYAKEIEPFLLKHTMIKFVHNKDYKFGQTSSFKIGLQNVSSDAQGVLLMPVDYPFIQGETLEGLIHFFQDREPLILIPTFKERKGHPPIFHRKLTAEFNTLDNASGVNSITHHHQNDTVLFSVEDRGVVASFNTKEEFEELKKEFC